MGWRVEKSKDADSGTYEISKSINLVKSSIPKITFPKSKNLKFSVVAAENKKHIPGSGHYSIDQGY